MNRNIFFVALIVLVGLSSFVLSGPQIANNHQFIMASANTSASNSTSASTASCTQNFTCADKGDTCSSDFYSCNSTTGSGCCGLGLYCVNSTCVTDNIGDPCKTVLDCDKPSNAGDIALSCTNGYCAYSYNLGDTCQNTSDCMPGLVCNNTICTGLAQGVQCNGTMACGYGLYCGYKTGNGNYVCMNTTASGGDCSSTPCGPWLQCINNTCQAEYSVASGSHCVNSKQCQSGLYCSINATCTAVADDYTSCSADSDCTAGPTGTTSCVCSPFSGKSFCYGLGYLNVFPCNEDKSDLYTCLVDNSCSAANNAPNSCCTKNCLSDYKKSISCDCSGNKLSYGNCYYNGYCGGFPIWAIIIIIVVAIVLVLGIVLLVFFMMRRRRQYESI